MEAKLIRTSMLKEVIDSVKNIIHVASFEFRENEIKMQAMTSDNLSVVEISLQSSFFFFYRCDRLIKLGIYLAQFSHLMACAKDDDILILKKDVHSEDLTVIFESPNQDRKVDCELLVVDLLDVAFQIPETDYRCIIHMPTREFRKIITDLMEIDDHCTIRCADEGIRFIANGYFGSVSVLIGKNFNSVVIDMSEPVELRFALKYFHRMTEASCLGPSMRIYLSHDIPSCLEYPIGSNGYIKYYLAPSVADPQDDSCDSEDY